MVRSVTFKKEMNVPILAKVTLVATALLATAFCGSVATAQSATSGSSSSSSSSATVDSSAVASASGGYSNAQIYLDQSTPGTISSNHNYSGSYEVRSAPAVQPPSMGSGHPCAISGSIGISLIGGGASGGLSRVDEACLLAQMGQGNAALIMIARRDSEACFALRQVGSIPSNSQCSASDRRAAAQVSRAQSAQPIRASSSSSSKTVVSIARYVTCSRDSDGGIRARKLRGAPFSNDQVASYCRAQMK